MPHSALRLLPGIDNTETEAQNIGGVSQSQLIRLWPDRNGMGLIQKIGGWSPFINSPMTAIVRALWAWEDTDAVAHLAVGMQNLSGSYQSQLGVITNGALSNITPRGQTDNISPVVSTTSGNSIVTITDTTIGNITQYDAVYIPVHISIGGLILFGMYACDPDGHSGSTTYTVQATNALGAPLAAPSSSTSPTVAQFTTVSGANAVTVVLANHGYNVGSTYPVLAQTTVGGVTLYGNYIVQSVTDANTFVINGPQNASSSTSGYINGGDARYIYSFGVGAVSAGTGFGIGGFGRGGFGTGTAVAPATGTPISADDWTLDNYGQILIACPETPPTVLATTGTSGNGSTGTVTFTPSSVTVDVGETVTLSGVLPSGWNGSYVVTASSGGSVSFATTLTSSQTQAGQILVNSTPFEPIYQYDPTQGSPAATVIPNAPPVNTGVFVAMPERQLVAYGSTVTGVQDPLLVRWSDLNNFNTWIATVTNQAGSYRLTKGSRIVGAIQGPQQGLIWTDIDLWSMQYINQPDVYSFNEIGTGCGLIAKKAACSINGVVYWMGASQFFSLDSNGVQVVSCPVWDTIFQDLDQNNINKIRSAVNSRFGEVSWFYPNQSGGGEVNAYVKYNIFLNQWDYGLLGRTAWIDQSVLGPPIGADPSTLYLFQHETSPDANGQALVASFQTGYFALAEGDDLTYVDQVWPDATWGSYGGSPNATLNITFYVTDYPGQTPKVFGPYAVTQSTTYISPRFRGRLVSIGIQSQDVGSWWRIGLIRYRYSADGRF